MTSARNAASAARITIATMIVAFPLSAIAVATVCAGDCAVVVLSWVVVVVVVDVVLLVVDVNVVVFSSVFVAGCACV